MASLLDKIEVKPDGTPVIRWTAPIKEVIEAVVTNNLGYKDRYNDDRVDHESYVDYKFHLSLLDEREVLPNWNKRSPALREIECLIMYCE